MADKLNPANPESQPRRRRVPMNTARQKLQVDELPGYRLYWFREDNVPAALDAYYEFVKPEEVRTNQLVVANASSAPGGTDLGSRMSIVADKTEQGGPVRAYLMKLKLEHFKEDQLDFAKRNGMVLEAMFGDELSGNVAVDDQGRVRVTGHDPLTYIDKDRTGIMNKRVRKARGIGKGRLA